MVRKAKGGGQLGSSLRKDKNKIAIKKNDYIKVVSHLPKEHKAEDRAEDIKGKTKLISVIERDNVNDFLYNAELK